tara:strand:- start:92 stop:460 length:369 start_codon:yes stop_codon:yes gene_type:complete
MFTLESVPDETGFITAVGVVNSILDELTIRDDEEKLLIEYFKLKLDENVTTDDSRIYIYLMLLHFFKARCLPIINKSDIVGKRKWQRFLVHRGFDNLMKRHFEFDITPTVLVDEAFLLWIIQ